MNKNGAASEPASRSASPTSSRSASPVTVSNCTTPSASVPNSRSSSPIAIIGSPPTSPPALYGYSLPTSRSSSPIAVPHLSGSISASASPITIPGNRIRKREARETNEEEINDSAENVEEEGKEKDKGKGKGKAKECDTIEEGILIMSTCFCCFRSSCFRFFTFISFDYQKNWRL